MRDMVRRWWVLLLVVPWIVNAIANPKPASIGFAAFMVFRGAIYVRGQLPPSSDAPDQHVS